MNSVENFRLVINMIADVALLQATPDLDPVEQENNIEELRKLYLSLLMENAKVQEPQAPVKAEPTITCGVMAPIKFGANASTDSFVYQTVTVRSPDRPLESFGFRLFDGISICKVTYVDNNMVFILELNNARANIQQTASLLLSDLRTINDDIRPGLMAPSNYVVSLMAMGDPSSPYIYPQLRVMD